ARIETKTWKWQSVVAGKGKQRARLLLLYQGDKIRTGMRQPCFVPYEILLTFLRTCRRASPKFGTRRHMERRPWQEEPLRVDALLIGDLLHQRPLGVHRLHRIRWDLGTFGEGQAVKAPIAFEAAQRLGA